jgi:hypothetical protein
LDIKDILVASISILATLLANAMGWLRFGKKDKAEVGKIQAEEGKLKSETALNLAMVLEKKIASESTNLDSMLQLNVNALSQVEKLTAENERIKKAKEELEKNIEIEINFAVSKIKENCNKRIKSFERELERSNAVLLKERQKHREEIRKLQDLINKNNL